MGSPWKEPFERFEALLAEAAASVPRDPNAATLATVDADGRPSARVVLVKQIDEAGFVFFSNSGSRKGLALRANPVAALCFHWPSLERQVRAEGRIEPVSAAEADAYFATRPRESQLGAWASPQSEVLTSREALEERLAAATRRYDGQPVPRPPRWCGYRLVPDRIEFWQAHPFRLHWRDRYRAVKPGESWERELLAP